MEPEVRTFPDGSKIFSPPRGSQTTQKDETRSISSDEGSEVEINEARKSNSILRRKLVELTREKESMEKELRFERDTAVQENEWKEQERRMAQEQERMDRQRIEMEKDAMEQELLKERFEREREGQEREQRYKEEMFRQREEHWQDMRKTLENFGTQGRTGVDREQADENSGVALGITTLLITS